MLLLGLLAKIKCSVTVFHVLFSYPKMQVAPNPAPTLQNGRDVNASGHAIQHDFLSPLLPSGTSCFSSEPITSPSVHNVIAVELQLLQVPMLMLSVNLRIPLNRLLMFLTRRMICQLDLYLFF